MNNTRRPWEVWDTQRTQEYLEKYGKPPKAHGGHQHRMRIASRLLEGSTVLDVGCGVGHLYPFVKSHITDYLGIDTSEDMLTVARKYFPEIKFEYGDVYDLSSFGTYDTVYCLSLLIHLPEIDDPIKEMWKHVNQALVFNIPIEDTQVIKKRQVRNGILIYHGEPWENILKIIAALENVEKTERHIAPPSITSKAYVKVLKTQGRP